METAAPIAGYQVRFVAPGFDLPGWQSTGLAESLVLPVPSALPTGARFRVQLRAVDEAGRVGDAASSFDVTVASPTLGATGFIVR
ncbi:MAG: hypothetical protein SF028_13195 [Candidatus Sumerlaeia bacterium]|nr:hypothetical protein [Candidatus Sumerlaeia bacterium]